MGYDLHEPLPDHSSMTRIRDRYGISIFRRFFEAIVELISLPIALSVRLAQTFRLSVWPDCVHSNRSSMTGMPTMVRRTAGSSVVRTSAPPTCGSA